MRQFSPYLLLLMFVILFVGIMLQAIIHNANKITINENPDPVEISYSYDVYEKGVKMLTVSKMYLKGYNKRSCEIFRDNAGVIKNIVC